MHGRFVRREFDPTEISALKDLSNVIDYSLWAIAWMELLFILPMFLAPFEDRAQAYMQLKVIWFAIMGVLIGGCFIVPHYLFSLVLDRRKDECIEELEQSLAEAFGRLKEAPTRQNASVVSVYHTLYVRVRDSKPTSLGCGSVTSVVSTLLIGPTTADMLRNAAGILAK
jgi:hypothetical protein